VWGQNFPREYDSFMKTQIDGQETPYGGSLKYDKLAKYPILKRVWAGYAFSVDYNEERGHYYALTDQKETKRQEVVKQPGACANCHAAEAPLLIESMGWETFNSTPYKELEDQLHGGSTCRDCHNPQTMDLWISRPAFKNAMAERGIDLSKATRQEMRTYVCAQCHVEYYFNGDKKELTFPWDKGMRIEDINAYYDEIGFKDWTHKETGASMLKMQHPEFETFTTGLHYRSGVACADCHMPYMREGATKVSDHWLRSPLKNVNAACGTCHKEDEQALIDRISIIQANTAQLLRTTEGALESAIDALAKAKTAGFTDEQLKEAQNFHRQASMRYDFVMSENSTGFHSPQESARVLGNAIDLARQAQISAERLMATAQN
jgi:nitrite reductase (cytochrome c-552)